MFCRVKISDYLYHIKQRKTINKMATSVNKSELFRNAWAIAKEHCIAFRHALKAAWGLAKQIVTRKAERHVFEDKVKYPSTPKQFAYLKSFKNVEFTGSQTVSAFMRRVSKSDASYLIERALKGLSLEIIF